MGPTKPVCTPHFFLCSVPHLNEYFQCSHSLYLKLQLAVALTLTDEEPLELLLPPKATSSPLTSSAWRLVVITTCFWFSWQLLVLRSQ